MVKNRLVEQLVGYCGLGIFCLSPTLWVAWHNQDHHGNTGNPEADPDTFGMTSLTRVDVDTVKGTVYLTGVVPDAAAKTRAQELAHRVDGVANVVNNLKTESTNAGDTPANAGDTPHHHSNY